MGLTNLQIVFDSTGNIYYSGQTVSGRLIVETDTPKNLRSIKIKLKGEAKVHWTESRSETDSDGSSRTVTDSYDGHEKYFENKITVFGGRGGTETLPPGEYCYPFSMVLPDKLPSSFEGQYGYIRYTVKGVLDRPWKFDHEAKAAFTVLTHVDLNKDPVNREPIKREVTKNFGCCCCESGPLTIVSLIPVKGYVSGQDIHVTTEVDNASDVTINHVVIELQNCVEFHSQHPKSTKKHSVTIDKLVLEGSVHENGSKTWFEKIKIPPLPPSLLKECRIIDFNYVVKIKARPEGLHRDLVNEIPITIGTIPLWEGQPAFSFSPKSGPESMHEPLAPGQSTVPTAPSLDVENATPTSPYPDIPPPSYEESMFGTSSIGDSEDNKHVFGITSYNPRYPIYSVPSPPPVYSRTGWAFGPSSSK